MPIANQASNHHNLMCGCMHAEDKLMSQNFTRPLVFTVRLRNDEEVETGHALALLIDCELRPGYPNPGTMSVRASWEAAQR